jgi:hypothetical protein
MTTTKVKIKKISNYPFGNGPRPVEYWKQDRIGIRPDRKERIRKKLQGKKP